MVCCLWRNLRNETLLGNPVKVCLLYQIRSPSLISTQHPSHTHFEFPCLCFPSHLTSCNHLLQDRNCQPQLYSLWTGWPSSHWSANRFFPPNCRRDFHGDNSTSSPSARSLSLGGRTGCRLKRPLVQSNHKRPGESPKPEDFRTPWWRRRDKLLLTQGRNHVYVL